MARKMKRSRGLGGSPEHHAMMQERAEKAYDFWAKKTQKELKSGACKKALSSFAHAAEVYGAVVAHAAEASEGARGTVVDFKIPVGNLEFELKKCMVGGGLSGMSRRRKSRR